MGISIAAIAFAEIWFNYDLSFCYVLDREDAPSFIVLSVLFVNSQAARARALGIGKCPLCPGNKGFLWGQTVLGAEGRGSSKQVFCIQDGLSLILKCVIVFRINCGNKKNSQVAHKEITLFQNK